MKFLLLAMICLSLTVYVNTQAQNRKPIVDTAAEAVRKLSPPDSTRNKEGEGKRKVNTRKSTVGSIKLDSEIFCVDCLDKRVIVYDAACKTFYFSEDGLTAIRVKNLNQIKVNYNSEVKFKVINVNRYMYDIGFIVDDIAFGSQPPALFNQLFLGSGSNLENFLKADTLSNKGGADNIGSFLQELTVFKKHYDVLIDVYAKIYNIKPDIECEEESSELFSDLSNELTNLKLAYHELSTKQSESIANTEKLISETKNAITDCPNKLKQVEALNSQIAKEKAKRRPNQSVITQLQDQADDLTCDPEDLKSTFSEQVLSLKAQVEGKDVVDKAWNTFVKPTDEQLLQLLLVKNNLSKQHFSYTAPPIFPKGNMLSIGLKISPRDSAASLASKWHIMPLENDSMGFDIPVLCKPFLSFSSGLFAGWGKHFRTERYEAQALTNSGSIVSDSAQYKLTYAGNASSPAGIAALANFGIKAGSAIGIAASVGAGVTIDEKPKPVHLGGLSLLLGNRNQLAITWGVAVTQVENLKSELYTNLSTVVYDSQPIPQYKKKLATGSFISVTYSIFTPSNSRNIKPGV